MTATQHAIAEVRRVARALLALGGSGTAADIAGKVGLSRAVVVRRLMGSGTAAPLGVPRAFRVVVPGGGSRKTEAVWGLMAWGRELAEANHD